MLSDFYPSPPADTVLTAVHEPSSDVYGTAVSPQRQKIGALELLQEL